MADVFDASAYILSKTGAITPGTADTTLYFGPAAGGMSGSLTTTPGTGTQRLGDNANLSETQMMANPETADPRRLVYVTPPLTQAAQLSGEVTITARVASNRASSRLPGVRLMASRVGG